MSAHDLAAEITKSAIENHKICFEDYCYQSDEQAEKQNVFNAKQISDFYKIVYNAILSAGK